VQRWGEGYFEVGPQGCLQVRPDPQIPVRIDLHRLAHELKAAGLAWPVLVRFVDILHDRVRVLCRAFASARQELAYQGGYTALYPVKVNQQRTVVDEILAGGGACVGLEAGSKPELMAVLAHSPVGGMIVCNGYKDREYVRLALIGQRMGCRVYLVIEKLSELSLILHEAAAMGVSPLLGVRIRLSSSAAGKWQNSGGEKAKFGLTAGQLLQLVDRLRQAGRLDCLQLLHSHIGSQIPNLRDIRRGMAEAARFYGELRRLGADIRIVDVGGGLGVDYEGTGTRHFCSINYNLESYAREVVKAFKGICQERSLPHPHLCTESGRAMTAHHAVLITNVIECDPVAQDDGGLEIGADQPDPLRQLGRELQRALDDSPSEVYQESLHALEEVQEMFEQGRLDLEQRALAEAAFVQVCRRLLPRLRPESRRHRALLDRLHERLADRLYCNFSLFQSLPDAWAIDQVFPVMPLHRLLEAPCHSAVLHDLTCDSDGCLQSYVEHDGIEHSLRVHDLRPGEPYLLGMFLVGAYQEILGDMHNLFGDTDTVNVRLDGKGGYYLSEIERGDSVDELLRYVHFSPEALQDAYRDKLAQAGLGEEEAAALFQELDAGLHGYTYFEE